MNEVTEKLQKVRDILSDPKHWVKGDFGDWDPNTNTGQVCLLGACLVATTGAAHQLDDNSHEAQLYRDTARQLLYCLPDTRYSHVHIDNVASFNDNPETTHEDVLKVIDCAIHNVTEESLTKV